MANPPVLLPPRQPFLPTSLPLQDIGVSCDFGPGRAAEVGKASALTQPGTGRLGLMQMRPGLRGGGGKRAPHPHPQGMDRCWTLPGNPRFLQLGPGALLPRGQPPTGHGLGPPNSHKCNCLDSVRQG